MTTTADSKITMNGESKTADEMDAFFAKVEREHADKAKELTTFLKVCADGTGERLNALTYIGRRNAGRDFGGAEMANEEMVELVRTILHDIVLGKTKLKNEKGKGDWNNGNMGSRWWDWEGMVADAEQRKVREVSCRVAFFSKKYSANWTRDKPYALTFDIEKKA